MNWYVSKNYITGGFSFTIKESKSTFRSISYDTWGDAYRAGIRKTQ